MLRLASWFLTYCDAEEETLLVKNEVSVWYKQPEFALPYFEGFERVTWSAQQDVELSKLPTPQISLNG